MIAWVRQHGPEYGADPGLVFVAGSSAGGYLGLEDADTSVTAVVSFVVHPDRDTLVVVEDARRFVESLRKGSASPVVYAELPGAQHAFDFFYSIRFLADADGIEALADWVAAKGR